MTLDIVHVEDLEPDVRLVERALRAGGVDFTLRHVDTRERFLQALRAQPPDVILADCKLPGFDGASALALAHAMLPQTPVIIVTGTLRDELAVELLHQGARDYILKDRLSRLAAAVRRAVSDAEHVRHRDAMSLALRDSELRFRRLFETAQDGILILDGHDRTIVDANPFLLELIGCTHDELLGSRASQFGDLGSGEAGDAASSLAPLQASQRLKFEHLTLRTLTGALIEVEVIGNAYEADGRRFVQFNIRDIRERRAAERVLNEQLAELRQFQRVTVDRELRLQELEAELARLQSRAG